MALKPEDLESLTREVVGAVNDFELEVIVHLVTGDQLYEEYVGRNMPTKRMVRELLLLLDKDGSLARFLAAIIKRKQERPELEGIFRAAVPAVIAMGPTSAGLGLSLQHAGMPNQDATATAAAPGLQRYVRPHLHMLEVREWLVGLQRIEKQICRIETGTNGLGTGFLVGASTVMTNWHVVRNAIEADTWGKLGCRFDNLVLPDGSVQEGLRIPLGEEGVVTFSCASAAELTPKPDNPPPTADELDYALLHLAEPVGTERGWVDLPAATRDMPSGSSLIIAQHPLSAPMKLAIDTDAVIGPAHGGLRVRYHTNTETGSSGSPCFNMDWEMVALHHLGDPKTGPPIYNQGIPAELILADIARKGLSARLAAPA